MSEGVGSRVPPDPGAGFQVPFSPRGN